MKKTILTKINTPWVIIPCSLALGAAVSFAITKNQFLKSERALLDQVRPVHIQNNKYQYINPLIGYSIPDVGEFSEFKPLEAKINAYITSAKQNKQATEVSVYFRDLNLGRWTGINENEQYDPASMLKVVIMIAYYKEAQTNPGILDQKITYTKDLSGLITLVPNQASSTLEVNKQYSIEQLIEAMIVNSDNGAKNALLADLDSNSLNEVFTDLGVQVPPDNSPYTISAKAYTLFFRVLYNSTYLNEVYSEKALELLNQTQYKDGLVAGLPKGTDISHKFGEHVETDSLGTVTNIELHDCGIVFHPDKPYVLCVMTRGTDLKALTQTIQGISKQVYESVDSGYKN